MMFWFTVRPAIKEFIQRVRDYPEQFRLGHYYIECQETGAYLSFEGNGKMDELRTANGRMYPRNLTRRERSALKRLGKYTRKLYEKAQRERDMAGNAAILNSINPEKLVKEND